MSAVEPVPATLLAELLELPVERVEAACAEIAEGYRDGNRGFDVVRWPAGYRYQTHPDLAAFVERFANWRGCRRGCRRPPSSPWPSSPTANRSPGARSPPCGA
jgi:hypothetical protein